jgi:DNA primase
MNANKKQRGKFIRGYLPDPDKYFDLQQIGLKGKGDWRDALCPFHDDRKPSLRINILKGAYRCMACGAHGGDVLAFHMHLHGKGFIEAAKDLGAWRGS